MHSSSTGAAHHFHDMAQQRETATLGMWAFLVTEVLFFGGLFISYAVYRSSFPAAFAEASHELSVLLGGINTFVLLGSSLSMALAVHAAQEGKQKQTVRFMIVTLVCGFIFLAIKSIEYAEKFDHHLFPGTSFVYHGLEPQHAQIYFVLYFMMTGVHALHMIIGIVILIFMTVFASRGKYTADYYQPVEIFGLYWHFVDIVWIFLYPLLYLINVHGQP